MKRPAIWIERDHAGRRYTLYDKSVKDGIVATCLYQPYMSAGQWAEKQLAFLEKTDRTTPIFDDRFLTGEEIDNVYGRRTRVACELAVLCQDGYMPEDIQTYERVKAILVRPLNVPFGAVFTHYGQVQGFELALNGLMRPWDEPHSRPTICEVYRIGMDAFHDQRCESADGGTYVL
ncbi:hypothetical protein HOT99_gp225 [Caulobacter phage CcrBL10]|uniref:Uncharacterized protein n=1 Tax=Caulobacter phage CcrBL10 TaxID=2283269 RepID=A0A385EC03_9CAUD|nr:hypothetical protein HOT99_gp225 [Caulobacter phage CcrBL10]AXQ68392.1 hypothetical protein CcrBL10_gp188c [Caulobacter phage CcrBL10]